MRETLREHARGRLHALEPHLERLQAALEQPRSVGRGDEPRQPAREVEALEEGVVVDGGDAGEQVVVAGEHLRGAVQRDVAAPLERAQPERRRERRVADDRCRVRGGRLEVGHRQHRVRRRLDQDQVGVGGRRARLVVLDHLDPPRPEMVEQLLVAVVGALGERDRAARRQHRQDDPGDGAHPGGEEQRAAAFERAELGLDRDRVRLLGAGVRVRPGSPAAS